MKDTAAEKTSPEAAFHRALEGASDDDSMQTLEPLVRLAKALEDMRPRRVKIRRRWMMPRDQSMRS